MVRPVCFVTLKKHQSRFFFSQNVPVKLDLDLHERKGKKQNSKQEACVLVSRGLQGRLVVSP